MKNDVERYIEEEFRKFVDNEQKALGLSDDHQVQGIPIRKLKEMPTARGLAAMAELSPNFSKWLTDFSERLENFKPNRKESKE